jgi:hypothetical protein
VLVALSLTLPFPLPVAHAGFGDVGELHVVAMHDDVAAISLPPELIAFRRAPLLEDHLLRNERCDPKSKHLGAFPALETDLGKAPGLCLKFDVSSIIPRGLVTDCRCERVSTH